MRQCEECDQPFEWSRPCGKAGRPALYCSPQCRNRATYLRAKVKRSPRAPRPPLTPEEQAALSAHRAAASTARWRNASPEERSESGRRAAAGRWAGHTRQTPPRPTKQPWTCPFCGDILLTAYRRVQCGKRECRLAYNAKRMGIYGHARRARKRSLPNENFRPTDIFDRDGWRCGICGEAVDRKLKWPHPKSPSLDHVVPLSRGGHHIQDNVRCSHLGCNIRRGNRVEETG